MIEYLSHHLVPFNSKCQINEPESYIGFKCLKCNFIVNKTVDEINGYWIFNDGLDHYNIKYSWRFLQLTCEQEMIKKLLE